VVNDQLMNVRGWGREGGACGGGGRDGGVSVRATKRICGGKGGDTGKGENGRGGLPGEDGA